MRVVHFIAAGDQGRTKFLAFKQHDDDSNIRLPVYREDPDGLYRLTPITFPSCTKFMYKVDVQFDQQMTAEEIKSQFGEIGVI